MADALRLASLPSDRLREVFAAHGVDMSRARETLEQRDQRMKADGHKMQQQWQKQKAAVYQHYSLWPGDKVMHFTFSDWKPALQADREQARAVGVKAWQLAKKLSSEQFNVFMNGVPGVGKTSLAVAMMDEAKKQGLSTMFVSTIVLQSLCYQSYRDPLVLEHLDHVKRAMKEVDFLVLDDFGTEGGSLGRIQNSGGTQLRMQQVMQEVADARWDGDHNRPSGHTIISSNNFEKELTKIYDPKTISRLIPHDKKYRIGFNGLQDVRGKQLEV